LDTSAVTAGKIKKRIRYGEALDGCGWYRYLIALNRHVEFVGRWAIYEFMTMALGGESRAKELKDGRKKAWKSRQVKRLSSALWAGAHETEKVAG
jgi:hypothetical protein